MLTFIGLGLNDEKSISVKGLEIIKNSDVVYLENYTSKLTCSVEDLEKFYNKKIILADRTLVEQKAEETILKDSETKKVCFLIIGDVFSATTHTDLYLRAKEKNTKTKIINNTSILTAIGITGLELYKFGKTTSIPFENKEVDTPYQVLKSNKDLHTLFLLDLRPNENRYMTSTEALLYLLETEERLKENLISEETKVVVCAAIGTDNEKIIYGKLKDLVKEKIDVYPQCIIIPGKLHFMEEDMLKEFSL